MDFRRSLMSLQIGFTSKFLIAAIDLAGPYTSLDLLLSRYLLLLGLFLFLRLAENAKG